MSEPGRVPPFPGAVGVTHLRVYDSESPDGLRGGTPHVHSACAEAYFVVAGHGAVQTLAATGFFDASTLGDPDLIQGWRWQDFGYMTIQPVDGSFVTGVRLLDESSPATCLSVGRELTCLAA